MRLSLKTLAYLTALGIALLVPISIMIGEYASALFSAALARAIVQVMPI